MAELAWQWGRIAGAKWNGKYEGRDRREAFPETPCAAVAVRQLDAGVYTVSLGDAASIFQSHPETGNRTPTRIGRQADSAAASVGSATFDQAVENRNGVIQ